MLDSTQLKKGTVFTQDGRTYLVLDYKHVKKGRGLATIRVKVKDVENGSIVEKTFSSNEKVESAEIEYKSAQFLYSDDEHSFFMDSSDYSQFQISIKDIKWQGKFLVEGAKLKTIWLKDKIIGVEIPKKVTLKVADTGPGTAGDTVTNAMKEAELETGYILQVPLFVNNNDSIVVNTENGNYVSKG
ncbi:elongation factor P [Patescibacteria group bacterium]